MNKDIIDYATGRHTVKGYDSSRKIPAETMDKAKQLLRFSASSTNIQPWHFIIASSEEGKKRVAKATQGHFAINEGVVLGASHVVVFSSRLVADADYLAHLLEQEGKDGRFGPASDVHDERKQHMAEGRSAFVNIHQQMLHDEDQWMARQTYLNIGQFLLGVAALGIDATPMEGVDTAILDQEFGLKDKGYGALAAVALGYLDPQSDYNAHLPKSRLPIDEIITEV